MLSSSALHESQTASVSPGDERIARAIRCAQELKELSDDFIRTGDADLFPASALQDIFGSAVLLYALMVEAGHNVMPIRETNEASATAVMISATGLLKSANLELFELGMWQAWSGTK